MRSLLPLLLLVPLVASSEPPSDAAIRRLLEVTEARAVIDVIAGDLDANMEQALSKALAGRELSTEQRAVMDRMRGRMVELVRKQMTWERLEAHSVSVYRDTFTGAEVDDLIAFYESPLGRTVTAKMPAVMRQTLAFTQQTLMDMQPEMSAIQVEMVRELQRLESAPRPPAASPAAPATPAATP
jgi:hypothetical protein